MRAIAVAVVCVGLVGCSAVFMNVPQKVTAETTLDCDVQLPAVDAVLGGVSAVAGGLLLLSSARCEGGSDVCTGEMIAGILIGAPALVMSAIYFGSALHGSSEKDRCRRMEPVLAQLKESERTTAVRRELDESRATARKPPSPEALELVARARKAAATGDCATVMELDPVVRELDPETHLVWFSGDAAIRACLPAPDEESGSRP